MIDKFNQQSFQRLRLNLRQLEVFLATARGGSTRAAADRIARSRWFEVDEEPFQGKSGRFLAKIKG